MSGLFGGLAAALVDKHLLRYSVSLRLILYEIDLKIGLEELGHRLLDEAVVDRLFRLVLVRGLRGEAVCHQHETVLNVLELDGAFVFLVLAYLLDIRVDCGDERGARGLIGCAAVFKPRGIVVVFKHRSAVCKAERSRELNLIFGLVLAVFALALCRDEHRLRERALSRKLLHIVHDAVFVSVLPDIEAFPVLDFQPEGDTRVDNGLSVQDIVKVFLRYVDVGKNLGIGLPADHGAGFLCVGRLLAQLLSLLSDGLALFKMKLIFYPVSSDGDVHVLGCVLRRAGAESVKPQRVFVVSPVGVFVFAARVQLTENKLPVEALLIRVPVQRTAAAEVLHLDGLVLKVSECDGVAVTLSRLVDRV